MQRTLDHPNIAKIFECFEDERHGEVHIIMELCTGRLYCRTATLARRWS